MIFHLNMYFSSTTLVTLSLLSLLSLFSSQVQADGHQSKSPSHHQLRLRQYADHPDWWALTFSTLHSRISSSVHNLTFLTLTSASPTGLTWTQCRGSNLTLPNRTMPGTIPLPQFPWALFIYEPKYPAHLRFDSNKPPPPHTFPPTTIIQAHTSEYALSPVIWLSRSSALHQTGFILICRWLPMVTMRLPALKPSSEASPCFKSLRTDLWLKFRKWSVG